MSTSQYKFDRKTLTVCEVSQALRCRQWYLDYRSIIQDDPHASFRSRW
jgi:hypothetical protein